MIRLIRPTTDLRGGLRMSAHRCRLQGAILCNLYVAILLPRQEVEFSHRRVIPICNQTHGETTPQIKSVQRISMQEILYLAILALNSINQLDKWKIQWM